jgi:tRNA (cmo5U34)-methyltransferase
MSDWDPTTYVDLIHREIPDYDSLQSKLVEATLGIDARSILELGVGSGETSARVLEAHPNAHLVGIDSSKEMLAAANAALSDWHVDLRVRRLEEALSPGPFDLVISALTVHHLQASAKAELFARIRDVLRPGGWFVLADVVVPKDPSDAITPLEPGYDFPSSIDEQVTWMEAAGLGVRVFWRHRDLAVLIGDSPA